MTLKRKVKLKLKSTHSLTHPYRVVSVSNSLQWYVGQMLDKREVALILTSNNPPEVIVK